MKRTLLLILGLSLGAALAAAQTVLTWSQVRVVTTDGWEYPNVSVVCGGDEGQVVIVFADGSRRSLERGRLRVITDSAGRDITETVLSAAGGAPAPVPAAEAGASPAGDAAPPLTPPPAVAPPAAAPAVAPSPAPAAPAPLVPPAATPRPLREYFELRPMLSGGLGFGNAAGDWYEGFTSGLLIDIAGRLPVAGTLYLGAGYRRQYFGVESSYEHFSGYDEYGYPIEVDVDWDIHVNEIAFFVGATNHPHTRDSALIYYEMGLAMLNHSLEATATDGTTSVSAGTDESKGALLFGIGGIFPLAARLGLDFGLDSRMFWTETKDAYYTTHYDGVGFLTAAHAGIVAYFRD